MTIKTENQDETEKGGAECRRDVPCSTAEAILRHENEGLKKLMDAYEVEKLNALVAQLERVTNGQLQMLKERHGRVFDSIMRRMARISSLEQ